MAKSKQSERLTLELENLLLRALRDTWELLNYNFFRDRLRPVSFALIDTKTYLGRWDPESRTIELDRSLLTRRSWITIVEVLKHEVAHQAVSDLHDHEVAHQESPHGPLFRSYCEHLGIPPHARDRGGDVEASIADPIDSEKEKVLDRIRKLLALAESPNQHEAETAAASAQRLMLKYNLEVNQRTGMADFSVRMIGPISGRVHEHQRRLSHILNSYFFVKVIWAHAYRPLDATWGTCIEATGTVPNLMMAEYVYDFLVATGERLWADYKKKHGIKENRDRLTFLAGIMVGFAKKLAEQEKSFTKEGLVWVPQAALDDYYQRRHPRIRTYSAGGRTRNSAYHHGAAAGSQIVLHKPVHESSSGGATKALKA
jgi:predicted SprT family Zn-dependent metalloprotease